MRKALALWAALFCLGIFSVSCSNDDDDNGGKDTADATVDADANEDRTDATAPPVEKDGFTHYTSEQGLPAYAAGNDVRVHDFSGDSAGNLWVAGFDGVYLLRSGASRFEKLTQSDGLTDYPYISIAGLGDGEAIVGMRGVFEGQEDNDSPAALKSGGADRLKLSGSGLDVEHYVMGTPPGVTYPNGRYKIRSVFTIHPDYEGAHAGDIWFGGNHGVALWSESQKALLENRTVSISVNGSEMQGDFWGVAIAPSSGDVWIGGAHREGRLRYGESGDFNASIDPVIDAWPDASVTDRTDDHVKAMAVSPSGVVWIGSTVNGLSSYDPTSQEFTYYTVEDGLPGPNVTALAADPDGTVWVGSWTGLGRYDPAAKKWSYVRHLGQGLPTDEIVSLQIDPRTSPRTLYIGTLKGVSVYRGE
ncbi:MAG: hypothetical protein LBM75_00335 [Myxococcales bacterium]|nr:hypothetical protein [Myxococcales bacterium]